MIGYEYHWISEEVWYGMGIIGVAGSTLRPTSRKMASEARYIVAWAR